jgi:hypothetical protein
MATFEQYENLPGVKVDYQDGNLYSGAQSEQSNTQSILIVGTALDGPVGEPVSVNAIGGPKAAEKMFGGLLERKKIEENGEIKTVKVPHQGTLIRNMWEALRSGNEDVRLLRIAGETAKTEIPAKGADSDVTQPLADESNNQLIPGNVAFSAALNLKANQRLVRVEKVEEFTNAEAAGEPLKTFPDVTGYSEVISTIGSEAVFFPKDKYRPKNTIKVTYKASTRNYTEVTRNQDGVLDASTAGLLTQDPANPNHFSAEIGNWSDDVNHQVNIYTIDAAGDVNAIPSTNSSGDRLWRIGRSDSSVANELKDGTTAQEFQQGGIRFTSAYTTEVANGSYPSLSGNVTVKADYHYFTDIEVIGSVTKAVPGAEKVTFLKFMPLNETLEVHYEQAGNKFALVEGTDFSVIYPSNPSEKVEVRIKSGAGPVGAKLFATYKTDENNVQGSLLEVSAYSPGRLYGGREEVGENNLFGVKFAVEYEVNPNGTLDMDNRVIRFMKPAEKKASSTDVELRFRTKDLRGVRTLREFANFVNSIPQNNIVRLEVPLHAGDVPVTGLFVTDYNVSPIDGAFHYRQVSLGEKYNEETGKFSLLIDDTKAESDAARYPWLGTDGFFNTSSLKEMQELYATLGGTYELAQGTLDEFELIDQGIYSKLENYAVDIILVADVNANTAIGELAEDGTTRVDTSKNFATQLAQHCAMVSAKTGETIGFIGVAPSPNATLREVQEYIDLLTKDLAVSEEKAAFYNARGINHAYSNRHNMYNLATHEEIYNDEGEPIDIGHYVNVVFGPEVGLTNEKIGNYVANGASIYAALVSQLQPEVAPTNRQVSAIGLRYNLSEAQQNQLAGGRFVAFESKITTGNARSIVVKDGVTAAAPNSDYQRLSTVRITHTTVQMIRQRADKFIGLPNGIAQRNSLATEIQAGLDRLKELGVLENFKFSIFSSAKDRVLGNAFITLELVPAYELRKIFTSVALRASL